MLTVITLVLVIYMLRPVSSAYRLRIVVFSCRCCLVDEISGISHEVKSSVYECQHGKSRKIPKIMTFYLKCNEELLKVIDRVHGYSRRMGNLSAIK